MKQLFVLHHLGFGDHIICNGAIRTLAKDWSQVFVFAKSNYQKGVARMFSDDPKISVLGIMNVQYPNEAIEYAVSFVRERNAPNFLMLGYDKIGEGGMNFDEVFYACAGVPFENRWNEFKINRNTLAEVALLNKLNPNKEPYMFVHDDPSRGYNFDPPNPNNLRVIRNDPSVDIFDMCGLLESASEIHCMESSFRCLIEGLPNVKCPLYLHKKIRFEGQSNPALSIGRKNWIEV